MNYQRIYDQLIKRAVERCSIDGYTEKHHILPRSMGGSDEPENLVVLTAREHLIAHWLLTKSYPENRKLKFSFMAMRMDNSGKRWCSGRAFEAARSIASAAQKGKEVSAETRAKIGAVHKGRKLSTEHRVKMSDAKKGKKLGPLSAEHRAKIGAANKGRRTPGAANYKGPISAETRARMSIAKKGIPRSAETGAKIAAGHKGKEVSAETRAKIGAAKKGKKQGPLSAEHRAKIGAANKHLAWQYADEIKALRATGLTYVKIAEKYDCWPDIIKRICHSPTKYIYEP